MSRASASDRCDNKAAIGGIIRESTDAASLGYGFVIFLVDKRVAAEPDP